MNKKSILIIAFQIYPRLNPRAHRATELAKELARQGHDVTLAGILGKYDYTEFEAQTHITIKDLGQSIFEWRNSDEEGILDQKKDLWKKGLAFFLRKNFLFPESLLNRRVKIVLKGGYDAVISVAEPYAVHFAVSRYYQKNPNKKKSIWISDCGDPFMGNPHSHHPAYFKKVERRWCNQTDFIAVPTEVAVNAYYPEFRDKIRVIPQGFLFDDSLLAKYKKNEVPTFAYSGMVYPQKRDPRRFLDYLATKKDNFHFVVYAKHRELFMPYKEKLGDKLEFRNYVPREQLIHELSKMDFLVNIRNESTVQVPSKLIDYYLTKRPIFEITSTFDEINYFDEFMMGDYSHQTQIENPERYNIRNVAEQFLELIS